MIILTTLLSWGGPALTLALKLLPIFYQFKILKTEAEHAEWQRKIKAAISEAESKSKDPVGAHNQYDAAKAESQKKLGGLNG